MNYQFKPSSDYYTQMIAALTSTINKEILAEMVREFTNGVTTEVRMLTTEQLFEFFERPDVKPNILPEHLEAQIVAKNGRYQIPVSWSVSTVMTVEADSLEHAVQIIRSHQSDIPLPECNVDYISDSFKIDVDAIECFSDFKIMNFDYEDDQISELVIHKDGSTTPSEHDYYIRNRDKLTASGSDLTANAGPKSEPKSETPVSCEHIRKDSTLTLYDILALVSNPKDMPPRDWTDPKTQDVIELDTILPSQIKNVTICFMCEEETWINTYPEHPILLPFYDCPVLDIAAVGDNKLEIWLDYEKFLDKLVARNTD